MVQKNRDPAPAKPSSASAAPAGASPPKRRGRPRAYEPEQALGQALDLFRQRGFAATSLDDLSAATGMNRPSLYGAFGDKRDLYIKSFTRYRDDARARITAAIGGAAPVRQRMKRLYDATLDIYLSGQNGPGGCFTVMTVTSEAIVDPDIRAMVQDTLGELDKAFAALLRTAQKQGELPASADPVLLGQLAAATLHTLSIRARAGTPRTELDKIVDGAIDLIAGSH
ncbi:TetR/AcrR family transcriptional regulator [Rhodopseudomonas sp. B29]|uniref:TetR/AcrR family transcriptional regulator n=1 Tax=Rhodopseudomonas sp. B29 TaxID=95607 RepID=UPI00034C3431|nr:TetR/AcrR family transcriptional regulator [Rhodopseudomonas sp. B29]